MSNYQQTLGPLFWLIKPRMQGSDSEKEISIYQQYNSQASFTLPLRPNLMDPPSPISNYGLWLFAQESNYLALHVVNLPVKCQLLKNMNTKQGTFCCSAYFSPNNYNKSKLDTWNVREVDFFFLWKEKLIAWIFISWLGLCSIKQLLCVTAILKIFEISRDS